VYTRRKQHCTVGVRATVVHHRETETASWRVEFDVDGRIAAHSGNESFQAIRNGENPQRLADQVSARMESWWRWPTEVVPIGECLAYI